MLLRDDRFKGYRLQHLQKDVISGFVVGIVAIPLGMAFAIASGVKPEYGLYTTIIAGIIISLLGGSRFQIGGPTGAFIPILFGIVMQYGYENLLIAGFMAGIMLILMGAFRLGGVIKYIPRPVTIGFTAGIAVIIFTGQIGNFLGLTGMERHEDFISNMGEIASHIHTINLYSVITALICLAAMLIIQRYFPKVSASLFGLFVSSITAYYLFPGKVATIGSTYGGIPSKLPSLQFPEITWDRIEMLLVPAFTIAMLGGIESLLSAVVADGMTGTRHNSNRELIGQGIANVVTPLFGGIPATGAIARTATNIRSGAISPLSGVIHGVVVLLVLLLFAPLASNIPLAAMAPILMVVAWNMSERYEFAHIIRTRSADTIVLLVTFLLTVFTSLTTAVPVGIALSIVIFVKRMTEILTIAKVGTGAGQEQDDGKEMTDGESAVSDIFERQRSCPQIDIFNIEGPLFFGAANMFEKSIMREIQSKPKVLILQLTDVPYMDTTGEGNLSSIVRHFKKQGGTIVLSGLQEQPRKLLEKTGLLNLIGEDHIFAATEDAVNFALSKVDASSCANCRQMAFPKCSLLSESAMREVSTASALLESKQSKQLS